MGTEKHIKQLSINGFKSIKALDRLSLGKLNVLIGANGAGKSSFVSYFGMLREMMEQRLQNWTMLQGSADRIVSFGIKETAKLGSFIEFGRNGYKFELSTTVDGSFIFEHEKLFFSGDSGDSWISLGAGQKEAKLKQSAKARPVARYCFSAISSWKVFHFHDTSDTAGVKRWSSLQESLQLNSDAANLAAFLYALKSIDSPAYEQIRQTIQLAIPFFDDFVLIPRPIKGGEEQVNLTWRQKDSDYVFWPSQLSDGSIRFICLVTALMQPDPPSTIIIDEPELGLHPYAITLLGSLLRSASTRMQVIVSTQSVPLVNEFSVDDLIVVEREQGATVFKRHKEMEFKNWLEDYSTGELWEKNILGGRLPK